MADKYMVGSDQSKDRYVVGQNGKDKYMVGGGGKSPGQADNASLTDGNDPVVSSKSAFSYPYDAKSTYKDVGATGDNSNFGGGQVLSVSKDPEMAAGGDKSLSFSETGDFSSKKDAMARRAAMASNAKDYSGDKLDIPSGMIWKDKVP